LNSTAKTILFWVLILATAVLLYNVVHYTPSGRKQAFPFSRFLQEIESGNVEEVTIAESDVNGKLANNESFKTVIPMEYPELINMLRDKHVVITGEKPTQNPWLAALVSWVPFLFLIGFWVFFLRQMQRGGNNALSFGKSRVRPLTAHQKKVTFKDVAGVEEAKEELQEIIDFLKEPQKFQRLGGRIPRGVLLLGPPGTGKTLLARAIAGEANVPFFSISGSDFVEMFVGVGASRVRDLFEQGKKNAPCIIFIDEIDAVGRQRGTGLGGGHDEREQTLNQLLVEMDGFESNESVILIAATNRPDVLDPALLRPGRFDRRVVVARPDVRGREGILTVHVRKIPLAEDVDIPVIARSTTGFSGADLANLVNEAALNAAGMNQMTVTHEDFESAKDKVLMGVARKSLIISEHEKRVTAYHEAGHAMVATMVEGADPLHKVTIIPRGMALGVTQQLPVDDRHTYPRLYLEGQLAIMMGGRLAEELFLQTMTTGAGNDIEQATELARKMVCRFGMSSLGPMTFGKQEEQIFLGREIAQHRDYSEHTAAAIDEEVRKFVLQGYDRAKSILSENREALIRIAEALLERESLDAAEVTLLIAGQPLEERRSPKVAPENEKPTPVRSKGVVRPTPGISPHEKPSPA
jgi:cell division protease FtsH